MPQAITRRERSSRYDMICKATVSCWRRRKGTISRRDVECGRRRSLGEFDRLAGMSGTTALSRAGWLAGRPAPTRPVGDTSGGTISGP